MKKLLMILLCLSFSLVGSADNFEVDGIYYKTLTETTAEVTYHESMSASCIGSVVLPSTVEYNGNTYTVTSIGTLAFHACTGLTAIMIPSSVTSIGLKAFTDCTSLTSVTIWAPSLTTYGGIAFHKEVDQVLTPMDNVRIYVPDDAVSTYQTNWKGTESTIVYDYSSKISAITLTNHLAGGAYWSTFYYSGSDALADANATVYTVTVSGETATLNEVADKKIKAGQAVVIKSSAETTALSSATGVDDTYYGSNHLKGVDVATTITGSAYDGKAIYTIANISGIGFYRFSGATLGANRAFLALDAAVSAPAYFLFGDDAMSISSVIRGAEPSSCYYDLQGRRVLQPTKGIYITNGRQYIMK